jgi:hypothetical protein
VRGRVPVTVDSELDAFFAQLEAQVADRPHVPVTKTATAVDDRRGAERRSPTTLGSDVRLSIRGGADAKPIDVSDTGVLAETTSRLRPGGSVELLLQINGVRHMLKATVVWSAVHSLGPTIFRTAFKFDHPTQLSERN